MLDKLFNIKRRFFKRELAQTEATIWATEFSRYTTMYEYEKNRQLLSQGQDHLAQLEAQLEAKDDKATRENKELLEKQIEQLKTTMKDLEIMINGSPVTEQYPEGVRGIEDKLQAQVQKREHIKNFIKYNT